MSTPENSSAKPRYIGPERLTPAEAVPEASILWWMWIGARRDLPFAGITVGGLSFNKTTEVVRWGRGAAGKGSSRTPCAGQILRLSRQQLEVVADRLPWKIIRFSQGGKRPASDPDINEPGFLDVTNRDTRVLRRAPRAAQHTLPRPGEIEAAQKAGRCRRPYIASSLDEPLARYIYAVYLSEPSPRPFPLDAELPPSLEVTGLRIPPEGTVPAPDGLIRLEAPSARTGWWTGVTAKTPETNGDTAPGARAGDVFD